METIKRIYYYTGDGSSKNLLSAVMNNDCKYVIDEIQKGTDIFHIDSKGESYLHKASRNNNYEIVDLLIRLELDINLKNNFHDTPLHLAIQFNNLNIADRLIFKGADVNAQNKKLITPLHLAAKTGKIELVNLLIANQAKISTNDENGVKAIHYAVQGGNKEVIRTLVSNGASLNDCDDRKNTVLHYVCDAGNDHLVEFILRYLHVSDFRNVFGSTALHLASIHCNKESLELLIQNGYNPTILNHNNNTPLDIAVRYNKKVNADYLREHMLSIDFKERQAKEQLYFAVMNGNLQFLIEKLDPKVVNDLDYFGKSLLYYAITAENLEIVKYLVKRGANIHVVDEFEHSALLIAIYTENTRIIEYLIKQKADVNQVFYNRTFLFRSINRDNYAITKLLITNGADIKYIDNKYRTIFSYALESASDDVIELLVEQGVNLI